MCQKTAGEAQIMGLATARHILRVEPLASWPAERVAADLADTFQRYLTGALAGQP